MVKVELELSELELEMLSHCIESAIDVKHMNEPDKSRAKKILSQINKYL